MAAVEHVPASVFAVTPGGFAKDGRPESPRVYASGSEPAKQSDLAHNYPADGLAK